MVARRSNAKIPVSANKPSKSHTTKFIPSTRVEVNIIKAYSSKKNAKDYFLINRIGVCSHHTQQQ